MRLCIPSRTPLATRLCGRSSRRRRRYCGPRGDPHCWPGERATARETICDRRTDRCPRRVRRRRDRIGPSRSCPDIVSLGPLSGASHFIATLYASLLGVVILSLLASRVLRAHFTMGLELSHMVSCLLYIQPTCTLKPPLSYLLAVLIPLSVLNQYELLSVEPIYRALREM